MILQPSSQFSSPRGGSKDVKEKEVGRTTEYFVCVMERKAALAHNMRQEEIMRGKKSHISSEPPIGFVC